MPLAESYVVEKHDTTTLARGDATEFWAENVCRHHGTMRLRFANATTFHGGFVQQRARAHLLVDFWSEGIGYSRRADDFRRDGDESLRLFVPIAGTTLLSQDGVTAQVGPRFAGLVTKARAFDIEHSHRMRTWLMTLPVGVIPMDACPGPVLFDVSQGLGSVVGSMIAELGAQREALDGSAFSSACDTLTELLPLCVRPRAELPSTLATVDAAARDYVRRHAADPELTPEGIARALGWSLRQVQLALHETGTTPAALLRGARLDLARSLLRTAPPQRTVADIAHSSGFRSLSAFQARFKARFGMTPQEARCS
ncbi:AraC family transcriptional regulator [Mycolicibacterium sp. XJ870]